MWGDLYAPKPITNKLIMLRHKNDELFFKKISLVMFPSVLFVFNKRPICYLNNRL